MEITFGATPLARRASYGASGFALNGQQVNEEAGFFRAAAESYFARGNRSTDFSFDVVRSFNTSVECEVFILTHLSDLSIQADLLCSCSGVGDASAQDCVLSDAVLEAVQFRDNRGLSVIVQYKFRGGLFVNEDVPDPPDGEDKVKAATVSLAADDESKAVAFTIPFGSTPSGLSATILSPSGGYVISAVIDQSTVTASGFTARFGAAIPASGYFLSWIAVL
jgi:hypothetical protein